ncbi:MAG: Gmad2 immunoglobulin-like domain-containing protein [Acidimicrobiia bacterium]
MSKRPLVRRSALLRLGTAFMLVLMMMVPAGAQPLDPNGTFVDDDGSVHEASIEAIAEAGVTRGCNPPVNDLFCPEEPVSRAEMATFLIRAVELSTPVPAPTDPDAFVDDDDSVHEEDIDKLAELGVTRGCNPPVNDRFCPEDSVTRGQMAAFLTRAFSYTDSDPAADRFTDDDTSVFEADIEALASAGVTVGCNPPVNDMYCPEDPVTRAQMATFLTRALGLTPLAPPSVDAAALVRPAFLLDQPEDGPYVATLARYVPAGSDTPERAVEEMLSGLNEPETSQVPAFSTAVPEGSELLGLEIAGGVATVDLSGEFDDGGGSASMFGRLAQLTFTLLPFDGVDEVMMELEGVPVDSFSSEGIEIGDGLDVAFFTDIGVIPEKLPLSPAWWEFVESPFTVTGYSRAFEATVNWQLYDNDGALIAEGFETTGSSGPDFGPMTFEVSYTVDRPQVGELMVFEYSARDGSVIDLRETVLWLMP